MTIVLVLLTIIVLLLIDRFHNKRAVQPVAAPQGGGETRPRLLPNIVAGFKVPENVRYHPGHTWALSESPSLVRVGMDDFAGKLIGKADRITLPQRGQWIRQGQRMLTIERNGMKVEMVSPIEGSISNVNEALAEDPNLARRDPYGEGWLLAVQAPDAKTSFRNLLGGNLARKWMEEAAARLRSRMPQMAGALAQDGGLAVDDLSAQMTEKDLQEMTHEFFLC